MDGDKRMLTVDTDDKIVIKKYIKGNKNYAKGNTSQQFLFDEATMTVRSVLKMTHCISFKSYRLGDRDL